MSMINRFSSGGHPYADEKSFKYFQKDFILDLIKKNINKLKPEFKSILKSVEEKLKSSDSSKNTTKSIENIKDKDYKGDFNEYIHDFNKYVWKNEKQVKNIKDYQFEVDSHAGSFGFYGNEYVVYATPFWDGEKKIPVSINYKDGDEIVMFKLPFTPTFDIEKDFNRYIFTMKGILKDINKAIKNFK